MSDDSGIVALDNRLESNHDKNSLARSMRFGFLGRASGLGWVGSVLPFNIALGPMGTLVQLLILNLNGTVLEVGLAITLFNAVSVPAALFWGFVTDRFHRRRILIVFSFLVTTLILVIFLFVRTIYWVSFLYALFSFATTASTTPLNLLVMETERKPKWASAFAKFSMFSSVGQTIGLLLGMLWSFYVPLEYFVIPLAVLSLISATLAAFLIKEPEMVFERQNLTMNKQSFFTRLYQSPFLFLKIPYLTDFKRFSKSLRHELTRHTPLLYLAIFLFFLSAGIFNTSLVPALEANSISSLLIFSVILLGMIVQIISFRFAGPYTERKSPIKAAIGGLTLRIIGYGTLAAIAYLFTGLWFLIPVLIFYPLSSGIAYSIIYTSSNTMVFNTLNPRRNGSNLGVYSALVGAAIMIGSFVSGFSSFYLGFYVTFLVSAVCLVFSAWLMSLMQNPNSQFSFCS
jgi:MFS family permease